jgi:hypothetical protein
MLPAFNSDTFSTNTNTKTHLVMKPKTTKPPTRITKQSTIIFRPSVFGLAFVAVLESALGVGIAADDATTTSNVFVRYLQSQSGNCMAFYPNMKSSFLSRTAVPALLRSLVRLERSFFLTIAS